MAPRHALPELGRHGGGWVALQELWLEQRFAGYADYRRRTPRRLIPFVW